MTSPFASSASGPPYPPGTYVARRPEDVLALVPVVLGFTPSESIAMVTFTSDGRSSFHARIDLPRTEKQVAEAVEALLQPVRRYGVDGVCLALYSADEIWSRRAWKALEKAFGEIEVRVADVVRVDRGRYYPYLARDKRLQRDGVAFDLAGHPFLAQAVVEGRVLHTSRDELAALLEPDEAAVARVAELLDGHDPRLLAVAPRLDHLCSCGAEEPDDEELVEVLRHGDRWSPEERDDDLFTSGTWLAEEGEWLATAVLRWATDSAVPSDEDVARVARAVRFNVLRDAALHPMTGDRPTEPLGRGFVELWRGIVRRLPDPWVAGPAGLLAWAAWQHGEGALAWTAVDRSLASLPGHPLARLVATLLAEALRPGSLPAGDWRDGLP